MSATTLTTGKLTELIFAADKRLNGQGVMVTFTTINVPEHSQGGLFGLVTYCRGVTETKRTFHDEEELVGILGRIGK